MIAPSGVAADQGRILVVDDDAQIRKMIGKVLENRGYAVFTAGSGREAFEILESLSTHGIDLLLTAVRMPAMNGGELAKMVTDLNTGIEVLYMFDDMDDAVLLMGVLSGGVNFIAKPFYLDELMWKIRTVLADGRDDHVC